MSCSDKRIERDDERSSRSRRDLRLSSSLLRKTGPSRHASGRERERTSMVRPAVLTVADTIAKSFLLSVETRGDRPAIREKKFGIWQPTSWRQWLQISRDIAYALHDIGFRPGDVASIIANAVPEWVYADMGILCAGGVSSGIYPTDAAAQVEYLVNDSTTRVIFAEDEEQLDKILSCRARCPSLQRIVVFDLEGLRGFSDTMVM